MQYEQRLRRMGQRGGAVTAWVLRRRARPLRPGATVLIVNWNSLPYLTATVGAVRRLSPVDISILVVDNGSSDGSREYLRSLGGVTTVFLPTNVGHGAALDIGAALVDTEHLVVLDVDAFPIVEGWLSEPMAALASGAQVAGAHLYRNFIHPCWLVMPTRLVRELELTFRPIGHKRGRFRRAPFYMDTGEALSHRLIIHHGGGSAIHRIAATQRLGSRGSATVIGGAVYHNQGATWGAGKDAAAAEWREALVHFGLTERSC